MEIENQISITPEEKSKLLEQQHEYYLKHTYVLFEIIKEIKNRTLDILNSKKEEEKFGIRFMYAGNVEFLKKHLWEMKVSKGFRLANLYRSNALFKPNTIPVFTYHLQKRYTEPSYIEFNKNYLNLLDGFDMIFDIDGKDVMDAYRVTKEIKKIIDEYKLPYYLKSSGTRGFHLIIPAQYLPKMEINELIYTIGNVLNNFRVIHYFNEYIDVSVCNPKGLIKIAYSFDSGNVSLPLNDYEFGNFSPEKVTIEYVLRNLHIMNRGLMIRTWGLSDDELKRNVKRFISEYK